MAVKWEDAGLQSSLARARGQGSAKEGTHHWMHQRITAISNIPLVLWVVWSVVYLQDASYEEFTTWLTEPLHAILMILFIVSTFYHALLGTQVIIEDYIHSEWFKTVKLISQRFYFIGLGVACIFSILKVAFHG